MFGDELNQLVAFRVADKGTDVDEAEGVEEAGRLQS